MASSAPLPKQPSHLPHVLAALYAAAVMFASLAPFGPWLAPTAGTPYWLWAGKAFRATRFDVLLNIIAYVPLGVFAALVPRRAAPARRIGVGTAAGALLAFVLEWLQAYLPTRDASVYDFAENILGAALGALAAAWLARRASAKLALAGIRNRWVLPGTVGDVGLALLAMWLVAQCNPAIGLFATTWDSTHAIAAAGPVNDLAAKVVDALESALQFTGMGLFVALLVRRRVGVATAIVLLIVAALAGKGCTAALMLRPEPWDSWLQPDAALGIAIGALLLLAVLQLPRAVQVVACAILLLLSVALPALVADPQDARAPLTLFNWRYGQLLNFNGLTHTVLLVWPLGAAVWLFLLAGLPRWGASPAEGDQLK